jgi:hypothetical protein
MDGDFFELIGGVAEMFGLGEVVKGALGGPGAYAEGRSMQTTDGAGGEVPYVYERVLTRPRTLNINDR